MLPEGLHTYSFAPNWPLLYLPFLSLLASAQPAPSFLESRDTKDPLSSAALKDPAYLPAQIGGIVGAYAVSLVLVAITLLALSKKRREHLTAGNDEVDFDDGKKVAQDPLSAATDSVPNFSYPSPTKSEFSAPAPYVFPSPISSVGHPGIDPHVDQRVVAGDRVMAQQQLEEMYKYVMEHEDAKQKGIVLEAPTLPYQPQHQHRESTTSGRSMLSKKEKTKPANLNLSAANEERTQSRTSSLLSALRSPKKKAMKGVSISSPIMTPQSATFPRQESQEMSAIPPRHYAPPPPPPIPTDQVPFGASRIKSYEAPLTPDMSPESVQSIDERIKFQLGQASHNRHLSQVPTEVDPESATSEHSQVPLVGLPSSPKPGARFPSLPASPKPGATFHRPDAPSAVRTGGALPLRAYEAPMSSPSTTSQTTKQTVFERRGPLSPGGSRTPYTANAVPYSPYQPFTPCMPMTPSLVTKEDRKRMKRMVPKTPTLEMVQSSDEVW